MQISVNNEVYQSCGKVRCGLPSAQVLQSPHDRYARDADKLRSSNVIDAKNLKAGLRAVRRTRNVTNKPSQSAKPHAVNSHPYPNYPTNYRIMVELVEVEDEAFGTKQAGPIEDEDDYYTDTGTIHPYSSAPQD